MVYDVNEKGITALNKTAAAAETAVDTMAQATNSVVTVAEEYADTIGPHQRELYGALQSIVQLFQQAAAPASNTVNVLRRTAQTYQQIVDTQRFGAAGRSGGASGGAAGGTGAGGAGGAGIAAGAAGIAAGAAAAGIAAGAGQAGAGTGSPAGGTSGTGRSGGTDSAGSTGEWTGAIQTEHKPMVGSYEEGVSAVMNDMQEGSGQTVSREQAGHIYYGVHEYAGAKYAFVRGAYNNPNADPRAREMMQNVDTYIHAAPKFRGQVHRGINVTQEVAEKITSGEPIDMLGPSSWSTDYGVAERFSRGYKSVRIIFTLPENRSGASITHIASWDEKEVTAPSGVKYYPDRIERTRDNHGDVIYIQVHE